MSEPVEEVTTDAVNPNEPKLLMCSGCKVFLPEADFSSKQLKNKGKRKCKNCTAVSDAKPAESKFDKEMKTAVKTLTAEEVKRAQQKDAPDIKMSAPEEDKFTIFLKWLKEGKVKYPMLDLKYYAVDYRGVHANRRVDNETIILEVPLDMIMTSEVAKASQIGKKIVDANVQLRSTHSYLASYLCQERNNPTSKWRAYIDTLPQHYRNMPIYFDQEELEYLKGSFTLYMIEDRKESLKAEYDGICSAVPEFRKYSLDEFKWARLAVITRIFGLKIGSLKTDGLVPMADMLNHKIPKETSWTFDNDRNGFTITTSKRLFKGAQIFDSYGRKCNSRFFVNYGFSLEDNEDNQVAFYFNIHSEDSEDDQAMKKQFLGEEKRRFQIPGDYTEKVTRQCYSYLRIVNARDRELEYVGLHLLHGGSIKKLEPISLMNEYLVAHELGNMSRMVLSGFSTTLEEDNKILADPEGKLTMNIRNAILQRRGEKRVLQHFIDVANFVREFREMPQKTFKFNYNRTWSSNTTFIDKYITEVWVPLFKKFDHFSEEENATTISEMINDWHAQNAEKKTTRIRRLDDPDSSESD